ncbi:MAG: contractile injection system tape measure protein, partial [Bacteroidota bacterium]
FGIVEFDQIVLLVAERDGPYMVAYKDNVLESQQKEKVIDSPYSSVKSVVWEIVLGYLFVENKSYHDKRSFLRHLIQKLAAKYNLEFELLLDTLTKVVRDNPQMQQRKAEFSSLITDLSVAPKPTMASPPETDSDEREPLQWMADFTYYLVHGMFKAAAMSRSRSLFNQEFLRKYRSPDPTFRHQLDIWLQDPKKRRRMLAITDEVSINEIANKSEIASVKMVRSFLDSLENTKASLSEVSKQFIEEISENRGQLVFKLPMSDHFSEKKQLMVLLRNLLVIVPQREDTIIQFLIEAKPQLPERYRTGIAEFLMSFYQNMGEAVLHDIGMEISRYLLANPRSYWSEWLREKMSGWSRVTKLPPGKVLAYVGKILKETKAPTAVRQFVSDVVNTPFTNQTQPESPAYVELSKRRQNEVLYLLEHGTLPWWIDPNAFWNNFEQAYQELWSSNRRNILLGSLKKYKTAKTVVPYLNAKQYSQMLHAIRGAEGSDQVAFLSAFQAYVMDYMVPLGAISRQQHLELSARIFSVVSENNKTLTWTRLVDHLRSWDGMATIERNSSFTQAFDSLLQRMVHSIHQTEAVTLLVNWRKNLPAHARTIRAKSGSTTGLKEFLIPLVNHPTLLDDANQLLGELLKMILARPESFDRLLRSEQARKSMVEELTYDDLSTLIDAKLNSGQKESFQQVAQHLQRYEAYFSKQEYIQVRQLIQERLLLQLGMSNIRNWGVKEWSVLLYHSVNKVIGANRHRNILERLNEKLTYEVKSLPNRKLRFIAQLNELVDETSGQVLAETKELFQKMVEQRETEIPEVQTARARHFEHLSSEMDSRQRQHYHQLRHFLNSFKDRISVQQLNKVKQLMAALLEHHIHRSSLRNLRIDDWGALVFFAMEEVLGTKEHQEFLSTIYREKQSEYALNGLEGTAMERVIHVLAISSSEEEKKKAKTRFESTKEQVDVRKQLSESKWMEHDDQQIRSALHGSQVSYYDQAISYINSFRSFISQQDYRSIRKLVSRYLLLKLRDGNLAVWGMKDWGHLLFHSMNEVIGMTRNQEIRDKLHEQLNIETEIELNQNQLLVNELTELATTLPKIETASPPQEEQPYRKLGERTSREYHDPIFVNHAGLILLAPYLAMLFERCDLMKASKFHDEASKYKAVQLLSYAATGAMGDEEHDLAINKVLCGLSVMAPLGRVEPLLPAEIETVDGMLKAVTQQWSPLKETSIDSLRETFLQRPGKLVEEESFFLKVEQRSFDCSLQ